MSKELFNQTVPYDYQTINYYMAQRSPSTVHCKNTRLRKFFRKYLFERAISVFKWELPAEWDKDYFLYSLYGGGYIAVLYTDKFGAICQYGALGGYNLYYKPDYIIISNPLLPAIQATIDKECAVIKLQPDYTSIMDIVGYYADQLALASEAMGVNFVNVKTGTVFGAESKAKAESYKKMYDDLSSGNPAVVIDKTLLDEKGQPSWFPFTQDVKSSYVASDLLSDMRKIVSMFDSEIGIPNANTDKKERLITDEVNSNNVETYTLCELWKESIEKGLNKANEMFGLKLSVDWRVKPDYSINRPESTLESGV